MLRRILVPVALLALPHLLCSCQTTKTPSVMVFILGGQSNMDGCGKADELPAAYQTPAVNSTIWDNKLKKWVPPGTDSFAERRKFQFGPEMAFTHLMAERYPDTTIAIVKTSAGGTKLWKHWLPGQPMNERFFRNVESALGQLDEYEICGLLWMQGESDAEELEKAETYEENLKIFFADVRTRTGRMDLPIVMGRISSSLLKETPWNFEYAKIVQQAQEKVAAADDRVFIINTDPLETLKDNTHFNGPAQIQLGTEMGKIMLKEIYRND